MKHRLYIAILAVLVALWGCTRVEMDPVPWKKVTFSVGSYVPQTRAVSLDSEGITSFSSKGFLYAEGVSGVQDFFGPDGESIIYNPGAPDWAPAVEYFWPKSSGSYINFVSWYDELSAPTTATETSLVWSNRTIGANDNILVADVAWRYKENTTNAAQYTGDAILTGVPVLFHRMLSRVGINVAATPLTDPDNPSTTYSVQIQSISLNSVYSQGTLSLTNSDPGTVATTRAWTPANTTYFWNQEGTAGTIGMTAPTLTETPAPALAQRSMLPQPLNETSIDIVYTVVTYSNGTEIIREHDIPASIKLNTIKDSSNLAISQWLPNRIYTYNIIFDPRGTEIRLAPVLESDWSVIGVSATVE